MNSTAELQLRDMTMADVYAVVEIEQQVHSHPWTRGMFVDTLAYTLASGAYQCKVYAAGNEIVGYVVLMHALDEVTLLNISIKLAFQRTGLGSKLLNEIVLLCRDCKLTRMTLEVRRSNVAAYALYRKAEFAEIGLRRAYYPAENGREDAIIMEYKLQ